MEQINTLPVMQFASQKDWETWLQKHFADTSGIWLKIAKKESSIPSVFYPEALEVALCYGWIDGQKKSVDDQFWLQKFTPRGPKSIWSKFNCEKAEALIAQKKMKPAGLEQVNKAKADGRWDNAYHSQSKITIPSDFQQELDMHKEAQKFFATLDSRNRYAILFRIQTAKKPETRAARINKFITMLKNEQTLY